MAIQWSCSCGQELLADDQHAGRKVRCPICKRILGIPGSRQPATGAVVARRLRDEDEAEDDDRPRRGDGLSNRDRLGRARIGLGLHWGKTLCFLVIFAFALLACLVLLIVTISLSAGRGGGGETPAFIAVLSGLFTCMVAIALFVMPLLGAIGSLMCFWLPERSGGRVLSMVACGLDSAAFLFLIGAVIMYLSAVSSAVGRMGPTAPQDILKASVMMTVLILLSYLLMLAGWILHMLVLKNLAAYARDRGTAGDAVRMLVIGLITLVVPGILVWVLSLVLVGPRTGLAGVLIIEFLLIIWTGSLLAVAFKLLGLTSTVRQLL